MLKRELHTQIVGLLKANPAVAILGPRQVGKTTLAKQIAASLKRKSIYIDLEKHKDRLQLSDLDSFFEEYKSQCVIIDEVQTMPENICSLAASNR